MGTRYSHKYYDDNPQMIQCALATVIDIGDLLALAANKAVPADDVEFDASLSDEVNRQNFSDVFIGVALHGSKNTDADDMQVGQEGVYEYPCDSATFEVGDYIGIANDGAAFEKQKVVAAVAKPDSIGRCVQRGTAVTTVKFSLRTSLSVEGPV